MKHFLKVFTTSDFFHCKAYWSIPARSVHIIAFGAIFPKPHNALANFEKNGCKQLEFTNIRQGHLKFYIYFVLGTVIMIFNNTVSNRHISEFLSKQCQRRQRLYFWVFGDLSYVLEGFSISKFYYIKTCEACNVAYQAVYLKYVKLYNLIYRGSQNQPHVGILVSAMAMILFSQGAFWFSVMVMYDV